MGPSGEVIVFTVDDATLADLLSTPGFLALANQGGAGLVVMQDPGDFSADLADAAEPTVGVRSVDYGSVAGSEGTASPERLDAAASVLEVQLDGSTAEDVVAIVVANPPSGARVERASRRDHRRAGTTGRPRTRDARRPDRERALDADFGLDASRRRRNER